MLPSLRQSMDVDPFRCRNSRSSSPSAITLYNNIQRLKLNVAIIAPIHGRGPVPMSEFQKFIAKRYHSIQQHSTAEAECCHHCANPWTWTRSDVGIPEVHRQALSLYTTTFNG